MGDIAVLGVIVVGGWWFFNNYKNLGIGGGSSAPAGGEVPPLEGGTAGPTTPTTGQPIDKQMTDPKTGQPCSTVNYKNTDPPEKYAARVAFGKMGVNLCGCAGGSTSPSDLTDGACRCLKSGSFTAIACKKPDGKDCIMGSGVEGWSSNTKKRIGIGNCSQNWSGASAGAAFMYAHYAARVKPRRILNDPIAINEDAG